MALILLWRSNKYLQWIHLVTKIYINASISSGLMDLFELLVWSWFIWGRWYMSIHLSISFRFSSVVGCLSLKHVFVISSGSVFIFNFISFNLLCLLINGQRFINSVNFLNEPTLCYFIYLFTYCLSLFVSVLLTSTLSLMIFFSFTLWRRFTGFALKLLAMLLSW